MAVKTYAEQLEEVQAAIATVEQRGQALGEGGAQLTRADLKTLYAREMRLRRLAARVTRGGVRQRRVILGE